MSLRSVLDCIKEEIKKTAKDSYKRRHVVDFLGRIQFKDISALLPNEYFMLHFEPLYVFMKIIEKNHFIDMKNNGYEKLYHLLNRLFEEHEAGKQRLYFSDFVGVMTSNSTELISFSEFKEKQFERNMNQLDFGYKEYSSLKYAVFNPEIPGSNTYLKDAVKLNWRDSIYVSNYDRSHRFALLCKWNEIENRQDYEWFNVKEFSINDEIKKQFLEHYVGFLVHSKTLLDILTEFGNILKFCHSFNSFDGKDEIVYLIFRKDEINSIILNMFLKKENCICINSLMKKCENNPKI